MIDKFCYGFLNRVYGCDDYTQLEINSKLIQKIDEVIGECNNAFEFVDWLKEQGVPEKVQEIINTMLNDGTLENLININKLNQLKTELTNNINQFKTSTNQTLENMNNTINEVNTQMPTKANDSEVVKKGEGTLDDFNEETRRTILGLEVGQINAVLGEKNVTKRNINDNEVCLNHQLIKHLKI